LWWPSLTKDMQIETDSVLEWYDRRRAHSTTSGSNEVVVVEKVRYFKSID